MFAHHGGQTRPPSPVGDVADLDSCFPRKNLGWQVTPSEEAAGTEGIVVWFSLTIPDQVLQRLPGTVVRDNDKRHIDGETSDGNEVIACKGGLRPFAISHSSAFVVVEESRPSV